jgi:hypothetical protein
MNELGFLLQKYNISLARSVITDHEDNLETIHPSESFVRCDSVVMSV